MATSSKVQFKLETLQKEALKSIDDRILMKHLELESYDSEEAAEQRVKEWRARQEQRISDLFRRLGDGGIDDNTLSRFCVEPIPEVTSYERDKAERDIRQLQSRRSRIIAKAQSLVPDEAGNIALTKTQLADFFDL